MLGTEGRSSDLWADAWLACVLPGERCHLPDLSCESRDCNARFQGLTSLPDRAAGRGYNTAAEREAAREMPGVHVLSLEQMCLLLRWGVLAGVRSPAPAAPNCCPCLCCRWVQARLLLRRGVLDRIWGLTINPKVSAAKPGVLWLLPCSSNAERCACVEAAWPVHWPLLV